MQQFPAASSQRYGPVPENIRRPDPQPDCTIGFSSEGLVVARGSGYTLTQDDCDKVFYNGDGWYTRLSGNTVCLTAIPANAAVKGISLERSAVNVPEGAAWQCTASVFPPNALNKNLTWTSDNPSVATVSGSGQVTGVSTGSATISVTTVDGGLSAECTVTIVPFPLTTVYLNGVTGDDADYGVSPAEAVKTFARAKSLLSPENGVIYITGIVNIDTPVTGSGPADDPDHFWDLSGYSNARVMRHSSYTGYLVGIDRYRSLSLSNIVIDGNQGMLLRRQRLFIWRVYSTLDYQ
jgi:hypothetical protein